VIDDVDEDAITARQLGEADMGRVRWRTCRKACSIMSVVRILRQCAGGKG
jgi:hypothetical protein